MYNVPCSIYFVSTPAPAFCTHHLSYVALHSWFNHFARNHPRCISTTLHVLVHQFNPLRDVIPGAMMECVGIEFCYAVRTHICMYCHSRHFQSMVVDDWMHLLSSPGFCDNKRWLQNAACCTFWRLANAWQRVSFRFAREHVVVPSSM